MNKLINYLPPVLRDIMEYVAITDAEQKAIEDAWDALDFVMDNQFVDSATEDGVSVWERELDLIPGASDTLDERKQRIKAALVYTAFTYNWLVAWVKKNCGEDIPLPTVSDYTLRVAMPISLDYRQLLLNLRRYIPANMVIDPLILLTKKKMTVFTGSAVKLTITQTIQMDDEEVST